MTAAEPQVSREAEYYRDNIGKVKTVDEFLKNDRLYNYAMRANGLTDMIDSKAFMRKVLKSDLDDPKSFARVLVDTRYQTFARSFNFANDGKVEASTTGLPRPKLRRTTPSASIPSIACAAASWPRPRSRTIRSASALMPSVDGLLRDQRLLDVALTAYGFDPATNTNAFTYTRRTRSGPC